MALPAPLGHLLRPVEAFGDSRTTPRLAVGLVFCVALLHVASVGLVAGAFTDLSGSASVDNPAYPGDWQCSSNAPDPLGEGTPDACAQPEHVQQSLGEHAARVVGDYWLPAFVAVFAAWPLLAWLIHLVVAPGQQGFGRTLLDSAWVVVPLSLVAIARPLVVPPLVESMDYPGTLDGTAEAALGLTFGPEATALAAVGGLAALWSGFVAYGVAKNRYDPTGRYDSSGQRATTAAVVVTVALLVGTFVPMVETAPGTAFVGLFVVGLGLVLATFARGIILHNTRWDLIGMRGGDPGEPAEWRVLLQQLSGVGVALVGFFLMNGGQVVI